MATSQIVNFGVVSGKNSKTKSTINRWLFCITLIAGLFSFSGIVAPTRTQAHKTSTEQLHLFSIPKRTIRFQSFLLTKKGDVFYSPIHLSSMNFDRLEAIHFHEAQNALLSIKSQKHNLQIQQKVILGADDIHNITSLR